MPFPLLKKANNLQNITYNQYICTYMSVSLWLRHTASITLRSRSSDCREDIIRSTFRIGYRIILQSLLKKNEERGSTTGNCLNSSSLRMIIHLSVVLNLPLNNFWVCCVFDHFHQIFDGLKRIKTKSKKKIMLHKVRYLIQELPHNANTPIRPLLKW